MIAVRVGSELLHRLPTSPSPRLGTIGGRSGYFICSRRMSSKGIEPVRPKFVSVEESNPNSSNFRVVSYNILAQVYVKSSYFPHSPSPCLRWKARSKAIMTVLQSLDADFLCIQELDEYDSFYKKNLEDHGYSGIYIQRSGQKRDGCGIFYKRGCAELVLEEKIDYNDLVDLVQDGTFSYVREHDDASVRGNVDSSPDKGLPAKNAPGVDGESNDPRVRLKRDCVGIMTAFQLKYPSEHLVIVANTHIYWDPEWADVKLAQAKYLLSRLAHFRAIVTDKFNCEPSVIVCGDFNSIPGDKVYQYLVSGDPSSMQLVHSAEDLPISLRSVYTVFGGEPPFTNCTPDFTNTLDYIFFCPSGHLRPIGFLQLPVPESPDVVGGLPNYHHPSDHLPIGAEFEVVRTRNQQ